jgi:hypothetical protein
MSDANDVSLVESEYSAIDAVTQDLKKAKDDNDEVVVTLFKNLRKPLRRNSSEEGRPQPCKGARQLPARSRRPYRPRLRRR